MDGLSALPTAIYPSLVPTIKAFTPLLRANASAIKSAPKTTHRYGPHERQQLDVYEPASPTDPSDKPAPILVFIYGGGFQNGDKVCPEPFPDDLIYTNLGYFFSQILNLRTIIPDYRLIRHSATYPSGGEDVSLALSWTQSHYPSRSADAPQDIFLMGNSAGGVHAATFLLAPQFAEAVQSLSAQLRGAIFLGTPFDFQNSSPDRSQVLNQYFSPPPRQGTSAEQQQQPADPHGNPLPGLEAYCPYGLLRALPSPLFDALPKTLIMWSALDPEDEIVKPQRRFVTMWNALKLGGCDTSVLEGHNHLSPPFGLGTGDERAEAWAFELGRWIEGVRGRARVGRG